MLGHLRRLRGRGKRGTIQTRSILNVGLVQTRHAPAGDIDSCQVSGSAVTATGPIAAQRAFRRASPYRRVQCGYGSPCSFPAYTCNRMDSSRQLAFSTRARVNRESVIEANRTCSVLLSYEQQSLQMPNRRITIMLNANQSKRITAPLEDRMSRTTCAIISLHKQVTSPWSRSRILYLDGEVRWLYLPGTD